MLLHYIAQIVFLHTFDLGHLIGRMDPTCSITHFWPKKNFGEFVFLHTLDTFSHVLWFYTNFDFYTLLRPRLTAVDLECQFWPFCIFTHFCNRGWPRMVILVIMYFNNCLNYRSIFGITRKVLREVLHKKFCGNTWI